MINTYHANTNQSAATTPYIILDPTAPPSKASPGTLSFQPQSVAELSVRWVQES
jgi:hypothetical protein